MVKRLGYQPKDDFKCTLSNVLSLTGILLIFAQQQVVNQILRRKLHFGNCFTRFSMMVESFP